MHDELRRSLEQLQLEQADKPYFLAYTVEDIEVTQVVAAFGSLLDSGENTERRLRVELRIGDYDLDNSNFQPSSPMPFPGPSRGAFVRARLPIEDDYREIRRQTWLATDRAYKGAIETLAKKRAVLQNRTRSENLPDFSHEQPSTLEDTASTTSIDRTEVETLVRDLSTRFRKMPEVYVSQVEFRASVTRSRYLNSEGSSFDRITPSVSITAKASTQAADGVPLEDFASFHGRSLRDLPSDHELAASIDRMGARLVALQKASDLDLYNGPVLFEDQAAAELLAQALFPALLARRAPVREDATMLGLGPKGSLGDKIGSLVLPRFLSVLDDPTQTESHGIPLAGCYRIDEEGVAARPTRLIEHGILKTLLADRTPVTGVAHSTGNRRGGTILPSNVIISADNAISHQQLVQEMQRLVRERGNEFGVVIRRIGNPYHMQPRERTFFFPSRDTGESFVNVPIEASKVYLDGREELIRAVAFSGISPASFKDIVAVSDEVVVYSAPFLPIPDPASFMFSPGREPQVVSIVVPSLLFADLTLKKPGDEVPRLPIVPHPYFARDGGK